MRFSLQVLSSIGVVACGLSIGCGQSYDSTPMRRSMVHLQEQTGELNSTTQPTPQSTVGPQQESPQTEPAAPPSTISPATSPSVEQNK